jgi:hypothetical protein
MCCVKLVDLFTSTRCVLLCTELSALSGARLQQQQLSQGEYVLTKEFPVSTVGKDLLFAQRSSLVYVVFVLHASTGGAQ